MTSIVKVHSNLGTLEKIYTLFDTAMDPFPFACEKQCSDCCTCNVTATGLEVSYIQDRLGADALDNIRDRLSRAGETRRFRPSRTTNGFAKACMEGRDTDEEENDPTWGTCPLLEDGMCTIYPVRPLGCRVMMSTISCKQTGQGDMPDLALTITTVFMQFVEHMDAGGLYGSFLDLLAHAPNNGMGEKGLPEQGKIGGTAKNIKIPALMIPTEHMDNTRDLVQSLGRLIL